MPPTPTPIHAAEGMRDFYVPAFTVDIDGSPLPPDVAGDVLSLKYRDGVNRIDSVELSVNNWEAAGGRFKYIGRSDEASEEGRRFAQAFAPGRRIRIAMGYRGGDLQEMLRGRITTLDPDFPANGGSSLTVTALNELHELMRRQHTHTWERKRDSEIAEDLGRRPVSDRRPGLGIRVDAPAAPDESPERFVFMNNQYEIVFLLMRARRRGYSLKMRSDAQGRYLYFGPDERANDLVYELEWGRSLESFNPTLKTTDQVTEVTVRGWDRRTRTRISETARWGDAGLEHNRDCNVLLGGFDGRTEIVDDRPVRDAGEARELATALLRAQLQDMITATGVTVGLPGLTAGRQVQIKGFGPCLSGRYFVTESIHEIGKQGYRTRFTARREGPLEESQ